MVVLVSRRVGESLSSWREVVRVHHEAEAGVGTRARDTVTTQRGPGAPLCAFGELRVLRVQAFVVLAEGCVHRVGVRVGG